MKKVLFILLMSRLSTFVGIQAMGTTPNYQPVIDEIKSRYETQQPLSFVEGKHKGFTNFGINNVTTIVNDILASHNLLKTPQFVQELVPQLTPSMSFARTVGIHVLAQCIEKEVKNQKINPKLSLIAMAEQYERDPDADNKFNAREVAFLNSGEVPPATPSLFNGHSQEEQVAFITYCYQNYEDNWVHELNKP
jgi:hypothetical protein